jgi:hypothetical protein
MLRRLLITIPAGLAAMLLLWRVGVQPNVALGMAIGIGAFGSVLVNHPAGANHRSTWAWAVVNGFLLGALSAVLVAWLT